MKDDTPAGDLEPGLGIGGRPATGNEKDERREKGVDHEEIVLENKGVPEDFRVLLRPGRQGSEGTRPQERRGVGKALKPGEASARQHTGIGSTGRVPPGKRRRDTGNEPEGREGPSYWELLLDKVRREWAQREERPNPEERTNVKGRGIKAQARSLLRKIRRWFE